METDTLFSEIRSIPYQWNNQSPAIKNTLFNDKLGFQFERNGSHVYFSYENKYIMDLQSMNLKKLRFSFK